MAKNTVKMLTIGEGVKISETNHTALLKHAIDRIQWSDKIRQQMVNRFRAIDKDLFGFLLLDADDTRRDNDNKKGKGLKPVDVKLPLSLVQIQESVTVLLQIIAPDSGMYTAFATKEKQKIAKGFSALMNEHARTYKHFINLARGLVSVLKYNIVGWDVEWDKTQGLKVVNGSAGAAEVQKSVIRSGNKFTALNMYNTFWDPSVAIEDIPTEGEFYGCVDIISEFAYKRMYRDQQLYVPMENINTSTPKIAFYESLPEIRGTFPTSGGTVINWKEIFTFSPEEPNSGLELLKLKIWLEPAKFGLSTSTDLELWELKIINGMQIVYAKHLNYAHGLLPCAFAQVLLDEQGLNTKSYAEMLAPFNTFSSFQMNVHQRASRKALIGTTFYDQRAIPGMKDGTYDMESGAIPVDTKQQRLDDIIRTYYNAPNTEHTLRDIGAMSEMMQNILPTDLMKQVTSLERATRYQAAATVQGADRNNLKLAKFVYEQALAPTRRMQVYNILLFQEAVTIIDEQGNEIEVDPSEFRDAKIDLAVSDSLGGLDKLSVAEGILEVLNYLIQSQWANRYDVAGIINYLTTLWGDKTDFTQFEFKNEFDALPPEQKQIAFQLLQQAIQQQQQGAQ